MRILTEILKIFIYLFSSVGPSQQNESKPRTWLNQFFITRQSCRTHLTALSQGLTQPRLSDTLRMPLLLPSQQMWRAIVPARKTIPTMVISYPSTDRPAQRETEFAGSPTRRGRNSRAFKLLLHCTLHVQNVTSRRPIASSEIFHRADALQQLQPRGHGCFDAGTRRGNA